MPKQHPELVMCSYLSQHTVNLPALDNKELKLDNPEGNQPWIFIERTDPETETPILCPPDAKSWLIRKDPDAGEDWRQKEKGMTEDEVLRWHHWLNGPEFEQTPGDGRQGSLMCCSPWGHRESDAMEWLSNSNNHDARPVTQGSTVVRPKLRAQEDRNTEVREQWSPTAMF